MAAQAQAGPAVDLRNDRDVRFTLFNMLFDWDGTDLRGVYEPLSNQIGYFFTAFLIIIGIGIIVMMYKKWSRQRKEKTIPYKVIRPPVHLTETTSEEPKKRVVAVLGSTGFIGSHIAESLIATGQYRVHLLGRRFTPKKILPNADAVLQVDMMNYESLVNAFQSVDSVINAAAAIPTVYMTNDDVWHLNVTGAENVIAAAKEAGVKNLILVSGIDVLNVKNKTIDTILKSFEWIKKAWTKANEPNILHTCVVALSQIYGVRSVFWDKIISGDMPYFPKGVRRATFIPVEFAADAMIKAEKKLVEGDTKVAGQVINIGGDPSTFKEFLSLPQWEHQIKNMPLPLLTLIAWFNLIIAQVTGWAPMDPELSPAICSFFDVDEEEIDNTAAQDALGIGDVPPIEEGVTKMITRFHDMEGGKKTK